MLKSIKEGMKQNETGYFDMFTKEPLKVGDEVHFDVENQDMWCGDTRGILTKDNEGDTDIKCDFSGKVTIGNGNDAYPGSLRKLKNKGSE